MIDREPLRVLEGGRSHLDARPELRTLVRIVLALAAVGLVTVVLGLALLFVAAARVLFG